jgi:general secretion pathway protein D
MVDNNKILVLGGMIDNHVREKHNKVPLLGDIPILGHLFRIIF